MVVLVDNSNSFFGTLYRGLGKRLGAFMHAESCQIRANMNKAAMQPQPKPIFIVGRVPKRGIPFTGLGISAASEDSAGAGRRDELGNHFLVTVFRSNDMAYNSG